jgi:RNA polymerase sigma-70 factor (ECF subfamily)
MPTITPSLLARLQAAAPDEEAWGRLIELFGPVVYGRCRRAGVPGQDVADVGQDVFVEVMRGIAHFRRDRPGDTFRGWLACITQRRIADYWRLRHHAAEGNAAGGSAARDRLAEVPEPSGRGEDRATTSPAPETAAGASPEPADAGEGDDLRGRALRLIAARFEPRTWQACWLVVMEGRPMEAAAEELGMTANAVRIAKSRVLTCLRDEFAGLLD